MVKRNCRIYFTSPMKLDFEGNLYKERHLVRVKVFLRCVTSELEFMVVTVERVLG